MNDYVTSHIRTLVPMIIGAAVTWAAAKGFEVDPDVQSWAVMALTSAISAGYYTIARLLERKFPKAGLLLGSMKTPNYK